jgi:transcriptional regulator with XRE-family HTH domain
MSDRTFAERLKRLREAAGLTQPELAGRAGMNRFGVAKLEQGVREPSWGTVQALARALGVDVNAFVVDQGQGGEASGGKSTPAPAKPRKRGDLPPAQEKPARRKPPRGKGG